MARSYSMDGRSALVAANRDRLISATLDVVAESGPEAVTMQSVADRASVAVRTVYNYFETKDRLLAEAFETLVSQTQFEVDVDVAATTADERLAQFVHALFDSYRAQARHMPALLGVRGVAELDKRIHDIRTWRHAQLARLLRGAGVRGAALVRASAAGFALTAYASYEALTTDLTLSHDQAIGSVADSLAALAATAPGGRGRRT